MDEKKNGGVVTSQIVVVKGDNNKINQSSNAQSKETEVFLKIIAFFIDHPGIVFGAIGAVGTYFLAPSNLGTVASDLITATAVGVAIFCLSIEIKRRLKNFPRNLSTCSVQLLVDALLTPNCKSFVVKEGTVCLDVERDRVCRAIQNGNGQNELKELIAWKYLSRQGDFYEITEKARNDSEKLIQRDNLRVWSSFDNETQRFFDFFVQDECLINAEICFNKNDIQINNCVYVGIRQNYNMCRSLTPISVLDFCFEENLLLSRYTQEFHYPDDEEKANSEHMLITGLFKTKLTDRGKQLVKTMISKRQ